MEKEHKILIGIILANLILWGSIIYIAIHFIKKF